MPRLNTYIVSVVLIFTLISVNVTAIGDSMEGFFEMSIEELMQVPIVTSASRLPQETGKLTSPVTVITAQDIHDSGLTSIPEILQFACGVDVIQIDRRRYAIGVHGLHETFSDRTTLMINGRAADNPVYGGPDFQGLPLLVEDIERIEVVHSPGSAAWGANTLTGFVNIVTKKPEDVLGGMVKSTVDEHGDSYTHVRWAEKQDKWSWKISAGYEDVKSSEDVISGGADYRSFSPGLNNMIGFNSYQARDFSRNRRIDTETYYAISDMTRLSFGIGHTHINGGGFELGGYNPDDNIREDHIRTYTKLDHEFNNGDSGYLQWSGKYWNANWPMAAIMSTQQNEFEGQYNFAKKNGHQSSIGASFRWDRLNADYDSAQQAQFRGEPLNEYNFGLFAIDRWELNDRWTLESQIRGDRYSETSTDWSGRFTALYALDQDKNHILRFSTAKAFSAPLPEIRRASSTIIPMGYGGLYLVNVTAPADIDNEETFCLEAGYTGKLPNGLTIQANSFYQQFDKLIGYRTSTNGYNQILGTADNIDGADSWGGDLELAIDKEWGRLSAWYSYNEFKPDRNSQDFAAFMPAKHKSGIQYRLALKEGWVFKTNYVYSDTTRGNPVIGNNDVGASNRLDLTLAKSFSKDRGEFMIGVSDLLCKVHEPVRESIKYTGHEVPGRTFFFSLLWKF